MVIFHTDAPPGLLLLTVHRILMICSLRLATYLLLSLLLCAVPPHAKSLSHTPKAAAHHARADQLKEHSKFQQALREYRAAYALEKSAHPQQGAEKLDGMGECENGLQHFQKALGILKQALSL